MPIPSEDVKDLNGASILFQLYVAARNFSKIFLDGLGR
jgi:hypothetical protein